MIYAQVNDCAKEIYNSGVFELYTIRNSSAEKVRSYQQLDDLLANGVRIYIQVGSDSLEIARPKNEPAYGSEFLEAHYEIASMLDRSRLLPESMQPPVIRSINEESGTGGFWEFAEELAREFSSIHRNRDWDGEFFDEIEKFVTERVNDQ